MRAAIALVSWFVALGWSTNASATPTARLVYGRGPGAESCPDETVIRTGVSSRIGYDPFFPYATRTVVLTMSGNNTTLTARIDLVENEQATARELTTSDGSCVELVQSAALAIAIAIDPRAWIAPKLQPDSPPASPSPPPPPPTDGAQVPSVVDAPRLEERPRFTATKAQGPRTRAMIGPRVAAGLQPGAPAGLGIGGSVLWEHLSIGLELESYLPSHAGGPAGARARAWLIDGALVPCLRRLPVSLCGVARVGRFEGAGERVRDPATEAALFLGLGVRAGVELAFSDAVSAHLAGDLVGDLARPALKIGSATIWQAPPFAGVLAVSTSYQF